MVVSSRFWFTHAGIKDESAADRCNSDTGCCGSTRQPSAPASNTMVSDCAIPQVRS